MLCEFELELNTTVAIKNICCLKGEGAVDHNTVIRWLQKFCLRCKNLDDQAKSGRPKTVDSKAVLQTIVVNSMENIS